MEETYVDKITKIKDYVEERMQQVDDLADHFMKMEMYDDVRQYEIKSRSDELIKVYEIINNWRRLSSQMIS